MGTGNQCEWKYFLA